MPRHVEGACRAETRPTSSPTLSLLISALSISPLAKRSAETQRWFDIGLNWCYGFNHEEGIEDQMDDLQQALDGA